MANNSARARWTSDLIDTAIEILGRHVVFAVALDEISDTLGFQVTRDSLDKAFARLGKQSPFSYLLQRPSERPRSALRLIRSPEPVSQPEIDEIEIDLQEFEDIVAASSTRYDADPPDTAPPADRTYVDRGPPKEKYTGTELPLSGQLEAILFIPDCHFPFVDRRAWDLVVKAADHIRQKFDYMRIVQLGDLCDMYSVSAHDKDPRRIVQLSEELSSANEALDELDAIGADCKAITLGNHEYRLERYLMRNAPMLLDSVSVPDLLQLRSRGWTYCEYRSHIKLGKLFMTHDVGVSGAYAAHKAGAAFEHSVVIGHCLPIGYEVLTDRGFVRLDQVTTDDRALCYHEGRVVRSAIKEVVNWSYTGDMACFDTKFLKQEMTDKHHIYTKDGRYLPIREALDSVTKGDLVIEALPLVAPEYPVADDMIRLVIAYCADGSKGSPGTFRFHFKKERKIARLTEILTRLGSPISWSEPGTNGGRKSRELSREVQLEAIRLAPQKLLPSWLLELSARQREIAVRELSFWDGSDIVHKNSDGTPIDYGCRQFTSFRGHGETDLVQILLAQHGILSSNPENYVTFNVNSRCADSSTPLGKYVNWKPVENFPVGCITTEFQNFFVRTTEGRIELSGNTHRLQTTYAGNALGDTHVAQACGWLGDAREIDYAHRIRVMRDWTLGVGLALVEPSGIVHLHAAPIVDYKISVFGQILSG